VSRHQDEQTEDERQKKEKIVEKQVEIVIDGGKRSNAIKLQHGFLCVEKNIFIVFAYLA
tara:strand:+ start:331 stop:507 length:177 start_codon:yes stop_codon:yes gene_type:complete